MSLRKLWAVMTLLLGLVVAPASALAHGFGEAVVTGRGTITMDPRTPIAGQPVVITVMPTSDDGHPLTGGTLTVTFSQLKEANKFSVTFREAKPGVYTAEATFSEKDWHGSLRYEQGDIRLTADVGFTVFTGGEAAFGKVENRPLDWRKAGVTQAPPWTDTATWVILVAIPLLGALYLWSRQGAGSPGLLPASPRSVVPEGLMTLAVVSTLSAPFSGYWDLSWHTDQGRDGLLSPPHLGIYGAIITTLMVLALGIRTNGGLKKIREFPALSVSIIAMVIQLASAPLDELWHRTMGLDISVWAPPHDMLIFGGAMSMLGLACIQAAADPEGKSQAARIRIMGFGAASLASINTFLAEFEYTVSSWHVSQQRPVALYPTLLALAVAATLILVARLTGARWSATKTAIFFWLFRAAELAFFLPAMGRTVPRYPALIVIVGAVVVDLVVQSAGFRGRYRHAAAGALVALAMFVTYQPLAVVLPVKAVPTMQLVLWAPLAVAVGAATGYLAASLGDYVLNGTEARKLAA